MVDLTKSLLDAISIIADKSAEEVSSDKTIKVIVKKVVDTSEGKYLVTYNSGDFYVYTQAGSKDIYQIGEFLYVLVPEGDMSQKKFIIGKVNDVEETSSKILTSSLLNDYVMIGNNIVIEKPYYPTGYTYVKRMQPLSLNSHEPSDYYYCYLHDKTEINGLNTDYDSITYPIINIDEESFNNSAKQAEALLIRAKFKASIDTDSIGHYGIIVNVAFEDKTNPEIDNNGNITYPPKLVAYILDTSKMTGNPMRFYDYTSQYMIASFDGANYLYIDSIIAFSEGFVNQTTEPHTENNYIDDINIYIDDLEIIALNEISAINGDYKLKLTTPKGNTIKTGKKDELKIVATTTYLNQPIIKDVTYYWGVKDPSITYISDEYNAKLGSGYRWINNNTNELILSNSELTAAENIYMCIATYKSDIILKTTISLYNNNNKLNITIESDQGTSFQFNEGNPTLTCLINGKTSEYQKNYPDEAFSFIWTKEDAEAGSISLNANESQLEAAKQKELEECAESEDHISSAGRTTIQILSYYSTRIAQIKDISYPNGIYGSKIQCKLKNTNTYVTYSCSVYRGGIYIGYGSITLQNSKNIINNNYYVTITNGTQVFQYDESGIAPNSQKHQNPIEVLDLIAVFHSPQGAEVTPKKIRWAVPRGKTLINIPSIGLETDPETQEKYFIGDIFPLVIKDTYDNTCIDNQVTAIVTHADGTEYRQSSNLLFTKIGEIGTNGTDTVVKINEPINVPKDECLTIIKPTEGKAFYNNGDSIDSAVLEASLYTNNTQVLGHTTKWTIAGTSKTQGYNYKVESDNNTNSCGVTYDGKSTELDTRIVEAKTSLKGKYFYNFYGIPAIEYDNDYTYADHPIKILRNNTLKNILYDSSGTNPTYNESQGALIDLTNWEETGYINWRVESGPKINGIYESPNLLLSKSPKAKAGSRELKADYDVGNIKAEVFRIRDTGQICMDKAGVTAKIYIRDFLADIEKIGVDTLSSTQSKLTSLWNRLAVFDKNSLDKKNVYIKTVYNEYYSLFKKMEDEYNTCKNVNKESTKIYDKIQAIWKSEWPSVITEDRLSVKSSNPLEINTIQQLISIYQEAYDDRSNTIKYQESQEDNSKIETVDNNEQTQMPSRDIFKDNSELLTLLGNENSGFDKYYQDYITSLGQDAVLSHPILIEYAKILTAYLKILVNEAQSCFTGEYSYNDNDGQSVNLYNIVKNKYSFAYSDWDTQSNIGKQAIGKNIYDIIVSSNGIAAEIYNNVSELYKYYQTLYSNVTKYQIAEESKTLNTWNAILNGQKPELLNQVYVVPIETFNGLYMNNNIVAKVYVKNNNVDTTVATVYIPIIMTLNTHELASLNGWDGTSIEIGDDHIMTPQIGAGVKDDTTNTFTGMVMGVLGNTAVDNNNHLKSNKVNKIGLMGYSNGKQSVFIDSKTGAAYFGLPEDDINIISNQNDASATVGTNEGRIELIPGGVSKIGNWKIGSHFLYNIVNGNYERRSDKDARSSNSQYKLMVPHDKHGIILSSDQPYIHIKGEVYEDKNLKGINYKDEYNDINPGDSLELRLDPGNKSLFSIVQHTAGFGDEDDATLFFGYRVSDPNNTIKVIKNYIANASSDLEKNSDYWNSYNPEYYIYSLVEDIHTGEYQPYYRQQEGTNNDPGLEKVNGQWLNPEDDGDYPWSTVPFNGYSNNIYLDSSLTFANYQNAFNIDTETGIITYNPDNLIWKNNIKGSSNNDGWQSLTGKISGKNFIVELKYDKIIQTPIDRTNFKIGKIKNNTSNEIYKLVFNYSMDRTLKDMDLNDTENSYVQFYITAQENDTIENALLKSECISIWKNHDNIKIDLLSFNNGKLNPSAVYCLKMDLYVKTHIVSSIYRYRVTNKENIDASYKIPPIPQYGTIEITSQSSEKINFTTSGGSSNISGSYQIYTENNQRRIRFNTIGTQIYDFILWRKGNQNITGSGQTVIENNEYAKFFTTQATELNSLLNYKILSDAPTEDNPWYISFYPKGYCTEEIISYNDNNISGLEDDTGETEIEGTTTIIKYKLRTNNQNNFDITMIDKKIYDINWISENNYKSIAISWSLILDNLSFGDILGFVPNDITTLCIEGDALDGIQGIPYAKTYWENDEQKVIFYQDYYDWVNLPTNINTKQYGYINVIKNNDICYKYIKTLTKQNVDNWFIGNSLPTDIIGANKEYGVRPWVGGSTTAKAFKDATYWKEFIRVGLDENGRFFSAGTQDKKAYNRTGRLHAFGKVLHLYGHEVRMQLSGDNYVPVIKIFAENKDSISSKTTYITQGQNDTGNISIRTAGNNNYIELAASEFSENNTNTIPIKTSWIKVSHNTGAQLQSEYIDIDGIVHTNSLTLLGQKGLTLNANLMSLSAGGTPEKPNVTYQISDTYNWIKTQNYILSSISSRTPADVSKAYLQNQYRIQASVENNNPWIRLEAGLNKTGLDIQTGKVILKANSSDFIEINDYSIEGFDSTIRGTFKVGNTELILTKVNTEESVQLINKNSYVGIFPYNNIYQQILLYSSAGGEIDINNTVNIIGKNGLLVKDGPGVFNRKLYTKDNLYSSNNIYVGYNAENNTSKTGGIYLYKDNNRQYVRLLAKDLQQLFDWYNNKRWAIGWNGTTVWLRNVGNSSNPEGQYKKDTSDNKYYYFWNWTTFNNYTGYGLS